MGDFDCCERGHDVPDPDDVSVARLLTRVRVETAARSDAESELARVRRSYEWALKGVAELQAQLDEAAAIMSNCADGPRHLAAFRALRGTGTPTGEGK